MKNNISIRKIFIYLILFLSIYYLGLTFISASLDKIVNPYDFSKSIMGYEIFPNSMTNLVALVLPWIELICGFILVVSLFELHKSFLKYNHYIDVANNIIILMLLWFIFILAVASIRGLDIDCGCGLSENKTLPLDRLKEDIYLLITAFIIKFRYKILDFFYR